MSTVNILYTFEVQIPSALLKDFQPFAVHPRRLLRLHISRQILPPRDNFLSASSNNIFHTQGYPALILKKNHCQLNHNEGTL